MLDVETKEHGIETKYVAHVEPKKRESFAAITARIRDGLRDGVTGPLRVASEVIEILDNWETFKDEAGMSPEKWVKTLAHKATIRYFALRADAARRIGTQSRRWDHHAAVWAIGRCANDGELHRLVVAVQRENSAGVGRAPPLSRAAVERVYRKEFGSPAKLPRTCKRCAELEAQVRALGGVPND